MKHIILSLGLAIAAMGTVVAQETSQPVEVQSNADIEFEKDVHDFGTMKQYGDASTVFVFTNTGSEPLIIEKAKGSCGCTVPQWPKEPILPGQKGEIKVKYDSKRVGPINKSVTITSNASSGATTVLRIKGNIEAAPKEDTQTMPLAEPAAGAPTAE